MATSKKILVAEDELPLAKALSLKLEKNGFDVTVAHNGEEALKALSEKTFDLVLLDLIMPQKDGFTVLQELHDKGDHTPVIVTSNLGQDEDIARVKNLGAVDFFIKSDVPLAEIVEKIQKYFKK